jgi:hypothetical protein
VKCLRYRATQTRPVRQSTPGRRLSGLSRATSRPAAHSWCKSNSQAGVARQALQVNGMKAERDCRRLWGSVPRGNNLPFRPPWRSSRRDSRTTSSRIEKCRGFGRGTWAMQSRDWRAVGRCSNRGLARQPGVPTAQRGEEHACATTDLHVPNRPQPDYTLRGLECDRGITTETTERGGLLMNQGLGSLFVGRSNAF